MLIELTDELHARLLQAAAAEGLTPIDWIAARLPSSLPALTQSEAPAKTMADVLAGRVGRIGSGTGRPSSVNVSESFAEYLEEKHRNGRL